MPGQPGSLRPERGAHLMRSGVRQLRANPPVRGRSFFGGGCAKNNDFANRCESNGARLHRHCGGACRKKPARACGASSRRKAGNRWICCSIARWPRSWIRIRFSPILLARAYMPPSWWEHRCFGAARMARGGAWAPSPSPSPMASLGICARAPCSFARLWRLTGEAGGLAWARGILTDGLPAIASILWPPSALRFRFKRSRACPLKGMMSRWIS